MTIYIICFGLSVLISILSIFLFLYKTDEKFSNEIYNQFNNCYSYAFSDYTANRKTKPQPGFKVGLPALQKDAYTCKAFIDRVKLDYPKAVFLGTNPSMATVECTPDMYLVFLALDNTDNNRDYHFYKKDLNGLWSHKPGMLAVSTVDADGNNITNPFYANRSYDTFQYNTPCGFFCTEASVQ
jgi:hypothetical protein